MNETSAIFLSRSGGICLCRVTSEGTPQSCMEPSTPFFFLPEGTAAGKGRFFLSNQNHSGSCPALCGTSPLRRTAWAGINLYPLDHHHYWSAVSKAATWCCWDPFYEMVPGTCGICAALPCSDSDWCVCPVWITDKEDKSQEAGYVLSTDACSLLQIFPDLGG